MTKILITPSILYGREGPWRRILEEAGFELVFPEPTGAVLDSESLARYLPDVEGVLASVEPYAQEAIANSKLRVIARMGVGYDAIDVGAATRHNVAVTITPGANEVSVAEQTIALMIGVMRGFPRRDQEVREGVWNRTPLPRLAGKTLGLVGLGRIGKAVVPRAIGLGLNLICYDPCADQAFAERHGIKLVGFEELLRTADIVSLHLPCNTETTNLVNSRTLGMMKPGSVLINTARGALVDEEALAEALASGHLFGAGLDVFKIEPLPLSSPLIGLNNVLLAPHMGGLDIESEEAMSRIAAQCIADLYAGRWPEGCVVNDSIREGWRWSAAKPSEKSPV